MTPETELLFFQFEQLLISRSMRIMTGRTTLLFEWRMRHTCLQRSCLLFMTGKTKRVDILNQLGDKIRGMGTMADQALTLLYGLMPADLFKSPGGLLVAGIAKGAILSHRL
jgi:hypothetical protein